MSSQAKSSPKGTLIRRELARLTELPPWGRVQENRWDKLSRFIYRVETLDGLRRQARALAEAQGLDPDAFEAYTIRRWYNHHTHDQILSCFYAHPDVMPEENRTHQSVDFYFRGLPFDLKLSRFPRAYPESLAYARTQPHHLARWQYEHQSGQGRYHTGNRFFIILHNERQPALSWQLRRDFESLEKLIFDFLDAPVLLGLSLTDRHHQTVVQPWAAVLFYVR